MKKSASFLAILVVALSAITASAQPSAKPQYFSGTNPRPQATAPAPMSSFGLWFSSMMSVVGL